MLCIITLTSWDFQVSALSGIPVLVIYLALTRPTKCGESPSPRRPIATGLVIRPLAFRVVVTLLAVLGVELRFLGPQGPLLWASSCQESLNH